MKTEKENIIQIVEKVSNNEWVKTELILEVVFEVDKNNIYRKVSSTRYIQAEVKTTDNTELFEYIADGWVSMEDMIEIHNELFTETFNDNKKTKITLVDKSYE